ncbi:hypothetical protein [Reyranella sp. CPCC 100927]|uniref:hypothetical protein n=1 Tax=Reyranella sp. CPCC 100927 TaxID=2599616 RepID=UPI0011B697C8|nr:hypothetical protein [Reyranella sp. CPCC 100927]TWS95108.1 hypothetical protein FQU96_40415 [Reyranella sp. CPCC 100927]
MKPTRIATALAAAGIFVTGWLAGASVDKPAGLSVPGIGSAVAKVDSTTMDPQMLAVAMGVASVAVDTEAAALRINELTDRLAALERRVQALEGKPGNR